jgi:hypothetical protein
MTRFTLRLTIALAPLFVATACGPESVGKGAPPVSTASTPVTPAPVPQVAVVVKDTVRPAISRDSARPPAVHPLATVKTPVPTPPSRDALALLSGRTRHDTLSYLTTIRAGARRAERGEWPVNGPAPLAGAVLPGKRIVAFYGNPLSTHMGVLGEYPVDEMLSRLNQEVAQWREADPATPVQPALHLIAVVAQGYPGKDGMYRLRMPDTLIERVYQWAQREHALLFLDIQVGHSTLQAELPRLMKFLDRPDVHLGIDPEFSMHYDKEGLKPGTKIGTMMASDVNYAVRTLADLAAAMQLPPKVLVVHRFTKRMVPNPSEIRLDPHVQIVMDMDGWGAPWLKFDSYRDYEVSDPVQFTGFKIFFHNDAKSGEPLIVPRELLHLVPKPLYIQYQ